jgi:transposase
MANRLEMAIVQAILQLHAAKLSQRAIALKLGVHRDTVARVLQEAQPDPKPAIAPSGSEGSKPATFPGFPAPGPCGAPEANAPSGNGSLDSNSKPAKAPFGSGAGICAATDTTGPPAGGAPADSVAASSAPTTQPVARRTGRPSVCEPFRELILAKLGQELSAKRIHQDLCDEQNFTGDYYTVRRFVQKLAARVPLPMRRLECVPGFEAQVDYGTGAPVKGPDGKRRKTHVFRVVLSHSRKGYSEVSFRQTTEDFLRALENAFLHFGGVPQTIVIDNLKAAVKHPDWYDPELQPKLRSFCQHYQTAILPTRPYTPRHKGKVERGVGYVQDNALKARRFSSLDEQIRHLAEWEANVADTRIHGTTRRQVGQVFRDVERPALRPLPVERFANFQEAQRIVHRDGHVEVARAYYSVPPEYLGRSVWARWDSRLVRVFNQRFEQIALHVRQEPGQFSTLSAHIAKEKISGLEKGAQSLLNKVGCVGPHTRRWAEAMLQARGIEGTRVLMGVAALTKKHPSAALEKACEIALSYGEFRLRVIRKLLARQPEFVQPPLPFLEDHPLIRPLADYAQVVASALERKGAAQTPAASPTPQDQATVRFERHDRADECEGPNAISPGENDHRGQRVIHPPSSGYPSSGCAPAEPDSVSPDRSSVVPLFPPLPGESSHA